MTLDEINERRCEMLCYLPVAKKPSRYLSPEEAQFLGLNLAKLMVFAKMPADVFCGFAGIGQQTLENWLACCGKRLRNCVERVALRFDAGGLTLADFIDGEIPDGKVQAVRYRDWDSVAGQPKPEHQTRRQRKAKVTA